MPSSKTNEELANLLRSSQVDRTVLDEAARRLQDVSLHWLLTMVDITTAIKSSPLVDKNTAGQIEVVVGGIMLDNSSTEKIETLAGRVLSGKPYDDQDVKILATLVLSKGYE